MNINTVETVPRRGYRFMAGVKERWDGGTESSSRELSEAGDDSLSVAESERQELPPSLAAASRSRVSLRRWQLVLVGLLLVSGLLFGLNAFGLRERRSAKSIRFAFSRSPCCRSRTSPATIHRTISQTR